MNAAAFQIIALRAQVDEEALLQRRVRLRIQRCVLRVTETALRLLVPASAPVRLEKISPYGMLLRADLPLTSVLAEVRLAVSPGGRLSAELVAVQTDLLSVPVSLVAAFVREFLPKQPWLHQQPGTRWEVDLSELARPYGVSLPPLSAIRGTSGLLELEFSGRPVPPPSAGAAIPAASREPAESAPAAPAFDPATFLAQLPAALQVEQAPAPGQPALRLSLPVQNTGPAAVWLEFRSEPFWLRVQPPSLLLQPGAAETISLEIDSGQVTAENHGAARVTVVCTAPDASGAAVAQRRGERSIPVRIPAPRRLFLCPVPECEQIIYGGDPTCKHCGAALRYCPECGAPALTTANVCSGKGRHPLPG